MGFYGNSSLVEIHEHRQEPGAAVAPPPPKPKGYEKSASSGGVMQVFMMIITDAGEVETEIAADEQKAQADYASFTTDTTASIQADRSAIAEKSSNWPRRRAPRARLRDRSWPTVRHWAA